MLEMSQVSKHINFNYLLSLLLLKDCFIPSNDSQPVTMNDVCKKIKKHFHETRMLKCMIMLVDIKECSA